jgi:hypothetical protein
MSLSRRHTEPKPASQWTTRILKKAGIPLYEHVGNSLDTNVIEKLWIPMRIAITKDWGRPHTIEWLDRAWRAEWENVHPEKLRAAVSRWQLLTASF